METNAIQSATAQNVTLVALANIQPNNYNPRKKFCEVSLSDLADSISRQGVLQPVAVRPLADPDRYELIYGERRYRASLLAGKEDIPAVIHDVDEATAFEIALTENIQREDMTPTDEGKAFQSLIDSGRHDVRSVALLFGKSEAYIRTRLNFAALIPELALLLEQDEITVSVASEICRYSEDIQRDVFTAHFAEGVYQNWRGFKAPMLASRIQSEYTTRLNDYRFNKSACASCPHNTCNLRLFLEDSAEANCANRQCLAERNTAYMTEKALNLMGQYPMAVPTRQMWYNEAVVQRLADMGYEVEEIESRPTPYPQEPTAPDVADYENPDDYAKEQSVYEVAMVDYREMCQTLSDSAEAGDIRFVIHISDKDVSLCYIKNVRATAPTADRAEDTRTAEIAKLEQKDRRNKEIALEKTVADVKEHITGVDTANTKFGPDEERMVYFFMLSSVRKVNFKELGVKSEFACTLSEEEKMRIVANLNAKTKAIIRRDYLLSNFKEAHPKSHSASLMLDFAKKHMPEELERIESGHNEVYDKRHQRLTERIDAIKAEIEKSNDTPDTPEPTAETEAENAPQEADAGQTAETAA